MSLWFEIIVFILFYFFILIFSCLLLREVGILFNKIVWDMCFLFEIGGVDKILLLEIFSEGSFIVWKGGMLNDCNVWEDWIFGNFIGVIERWLVVVFCEICWLRLGIFILF